MTPDQWGEFARDWGPWILFAFLLTFEFIVPRGRLRREEIRSDKAMDISEGQIDATKELISVVKALDEHIKTGEQNLDRRLAGIETRLDKRRGA